MTSRTAMDKQRLFTLLAKHPNPHLIDGEDSGPRRVPFLLCLLLALGVATLLGAIVAMLGMVAGVVILFQGDVNALRSAAPDGLMAGLAIVGSYFGAAVLAAPAFYVLQRWWGHWLGRAVTFGALGFIVYGGVGLSGVLAYQYLDINLLDFESVEEAWAFLPEMTLVLAGISAIIGPFIWKWKFAAPEAG